MKGDTLRTSTVETVTKPNLNEALFVARDLPSDHPEVLADRRFRSANRWPSDLPGLREVIVGYCDTMERLARKLVRLYAHALDLPTEYFDQSFNEPQYKLRMTYYPQQADALDDEFGIAPHTDTSFLTLLEPNEVPGLSIRTQSGNWIDAPAIHDAYVVNGGRRGGGGARRAPVLSRRRRERRPPEGIISRGMIRATFGCRQDGVPDTLTTSTLLCRHGQARHRAGIVRQLTWGLT